MAEPSLLLPERSVLLHIGPQKTGTTAIQGALFRARPQLLEHGVLHSGQRRQPRTAVQVLREAGISDGSGAPRFWHWEQLVEQVTSAADKRVIVSSEGFADATDVTARRAVRELGESRVHVVVTLRPLTKLMPSQWQQYVRNRAESTFDFWLQSMLNRPPYERPTPTFWHRHHHDLLAERWASIVGPENVTVIVLDESDRDFLLRVFEQLVGLPVGLLVAEQETENRSLTLGEIELVRQVNAEFRRRGMSDDVYRELVADGLVAQMRTGRGPLADEPRILMPQWALDRAAEIGAAAAEKLSGLGVRIVGDVSTLGATAVAQQPKDVMPAESALAIDAAAAAVVGTLLAGRLFDKPAPAKPTVAGASTTELLRTVLARGLRRARVPSRRPTS